MTFYTLLDRLKSFAGMHTRYGVRANYGSVDRDGFVTLRHAKHYAWRQGYENFEFYEYDPRDKRTPAVSHFRSVRP